MRVVLVREAHARSHGAIAVTTAYIMIRFDSSNGARLSRSRARGVASADAVLGCPFAVVVVAVARADQSAGSRPANEFAR